MKILFCFFSLCILIFSSCKKDSADPVSVLQSNTWYPYQTNIVVTDTTTITERNNSTGTQTVRKYNHRRDTVFLNSACEQQTDLHFQTGGTYLVAARCTSPASDLTGQWFALPAHPEIIRTYFSLQTAPPPTGFPVFAFGDIAISSITNNQFVVTNYFHSQVDAASNNLQYDSLVIKDSVINVTCKKR